MNTPSGVIDFLKKILGALYILFTKYNEADAIGVGFENGEAAASLHFGNKMYSLGPSAMREAAASPSAMSPIVKKIEVELPLGLLSKHPQKKRRKGGSWNWLFTSSYLVFMLLLPISSLLSTAGGALFTNFWQIATEPIAISTYVITLSIASMAALFNGVFGFILAWVLVRYDFPGKKLLDTAVDLPFALPTSVAGLTLATVYNPQGWIGKALSAVGVQVLFTRWGVAIAMVFVSFPFVVRTLQPVLQNMEIELEEVAWSLGASPWETFCRVSFPSLLPALVTGTTLAFSRAVGEYGSIVIVSANMPLKDLIASVLIFQNLEQYEYTGATVIGTVVLLLSLILLFGVNAIQSWNRNLKL